MFRGMIIVIRCLAVKRYRRNRNLHVGDIDRMECAIEWFSQNKDY